MSERPETETSSAPAPDEGAAEALSEVKPDGEVAPTKPAGPIRLRLFGRTDVGQVREHNEDNFVVADLTRPMRGLSDGAAEQLVGPGGTLLGVCDGMGGAAAGEVASQLAVDIVYQRMTTGHTPTTHDELAGRLVQAVESAGMRIFSEAKLDRTRRGMGTTATIAALLDDHLFLGQVGDSRGYLLRGPRLVQVTRDQSLVNQLIEAGQLTEEEAETFEHNNIILQALGTSDTVQVDLTYVELRRGDRLMLCSDGLSGMVRNDEIREVLSTVEDSAEACRVLIERANQAGGHDNITVVVATFEGEGLAERTPADIESLRYEKYPLPDLPPPSGPVADPPRRVKGLDEHKVGMRPRGDSSKGRSRSADERDDERDDPIEIPTDAAPAWIVYLMVGGALACVLVAVFFLVQ
jgi:serine/threonine protein phosphatase PrpC